MTSAIAYAGPDLCQQELRKHTILSVVRLQVDALSATVCYDMLCCIFQWSMSGMMGAYWCILTQKRHDCAPFGGQSDINAYDHI